MTMHWLDLSGNVVLVTGGGTNGSIGQASAPALAEAGAGIFVCDLDLPGAGETAREVAAPGRCAAVAAVDFRQQRT